MNRRKHRKHNKRILPVSSTSKTFILAMLTAFIIPSFISLAHAQTPETEEQTWTVNFRDADIEELIRFVAEATGKTIIIDPMVQGTVQVISTNPVNSDGRSEEHTSELQSHHDLVFRLLLEKKQKKKSCWETT